MQPTGPHPVDETALAADRDGCLTEAELTRLIEGDARLEQGDRWADHLVDCPGCRMVLAESVKHLDSLAETSRRYRRALVALGALVTLFLLYAIRI